MKSHIIYGLTGIISGCATLNHIIEANKNVEIVHEEVTSEGRYFVVRDSLGCHVEFDREKTFDWFDDYRQIEDLDLELRLKKEYCEENLNQ